MRIATWNVNSIRARTAAMSEFLDRVEPDVLLLQETRCADADVPRELFDSRGYALAHHGLNHRNGVAIASRIGLHGVQRGFAETASCDDGDMTDGRVISAICGEVRMYSVYVPNGRALDHPQFRFKLTWLAQLRCEVGEAVAHHGPVVVGGDFNVAPTDLDVYDPVRWRNRKHATPVERAAIAALIDAGFTDAARALNPTAAEFTWWNYRPGQFERDRGLRIDLVLVSNGLARLVSSVHVDRRARGRPKPSDHAPVVVDIF